MTGQEATNIIRMRIADNDSINVTDAHALQNLNTAIRFLSLILIARKAPMMTAQELVVDYTQKPARFHSFVGNPPFYMEGNVIRSYAGARPVLMRYWRTRAPLSSLTDDIDFEDEFIDSVIEGAVAICLNKDEFDVSFETDLFDRINSCLPGQGTSTATTASTSGESS